MSYARSADVIYSQMQKKSLRYWQVFDSDKISQIAESADGDDLTVDQSIADLTEILKELEGIIYVVLRSDTATKKRKAESGVGTANRDNYNGIYKYMLKLGSSDNSSSGSGSYQSAGMFQMLMKMQEDNHREQLRHLEEKQTLREEMREKIEQMEKKMEKRSGGSEVNDQMTKKIIQMLEVIIDKNKK